MGIVDHNSRSFATRCSIFLEMNCSEPTGVPNTVMPSGCQASSPTSSAEFELGLGSKPLQFGNPEIRIGGTRSSPAVLQLATHTLNSPCSQHLKVVESTAETGLRPPQSHRLAWRRLPRGPSKLLPPFLVAGISSTTLPPRRCLGRNDPRATVLRTNSID